MIKKSPKTKESKMDLQEPAQKKLKELADEELKLKERIKEIQTERYAILKMLNAIKGKSKKKKEKWIQAIF